MAELRITDTNSANDSKGRALGLEGNDFLYVLVGFVAALAFYLVLAFVLGAGMLVALLFSMPVFFGSLGWVLLFRYNKPEGYAEDVCDDLVNGEGWSFVIVGQPRVPGRGDNAQ